MKTEDKQFWKKICKDKPLYYSNERIVTFRHGKLFVYSNEQLEKTIKLFGVPFYKKNRLLNRLLRLEPKSYKLLSNDELILSVKKQIFLVNIVSGNVQVVQECKMSEPLNFCCGIEKWKVLWGEYGYNASRESISVYGLTDNNEVEKVYEFAPKRIRHIHNIIKKSDNSGYYILTGDFDKEPCIFETDIFFHDVSVFLGENQNYRSVVAFDTPSGILFATDTTFQRNTLYLISKNKEVSKICELPGTVLYGERINDGFLLSTTVEFDENIKGFKTYFTKKRGLGNPSNKADLLFIDKDFKVHKLSSLKKDCLSMKLFQYGSFKLPQFGSCDDVVVFPNALKKYDGKMMKIDYKSIIDSYLVIGSNPSGLFVARQLFNSGKRVVCIGRTDDVGRYSKKNHGYYCCNDYKSFREALDIVFKTCSYPKTIICSDNYLNMIFENEPSLFDRFDLISPSKAVLNSFIDKDNLYKMCEENNIQTPDRYLVNDYNELLTYPLPIVVKPRVKKLNSNIDKIKILYSKKDIEAFVSDSNSKKLVVDDFIFQKYVFGNNYYEYGYGGYFENGKPVCDVYFYEMRQRPQGICCYTREIDDNNIKDSINKTASIFINKYNYSGFIQFDFKKDTKSGVLYLLDINPRPWGSISIMKGKIPDGTSLFCDGFAPDKSSLLSWSFPAKNALAFRNKKNVSKSFCEILEKERKTKHVIDLKDKSDNRPYRYLLFLFFIKMFNKIKGR